MGNAPGRVGKVEAAEPEKPNDPRDLGRDGFDRPEIKRSFVDLGLESIHSRPRPSALGRSVLENMGPVRPLNVHSFLVGPGHEAMRMHTDALRWLPVLHE